VGAAWASYGQLHRYVWSDLLYGQGTHRSAVEKVFQHRLAVRQKHVPQCRASGNG
jgi:hypothetical protein